jgi:hypothetical protein
MVYWLKNWHTKISISCIIVANEMKMGLVYGNLYTSYM